MHEEKDHGYPYPSVQSVLRSIVYNLDNRSLTPKRVEGQVGYGGLSHILMVQGTQEHTLDIDY